MTMDSIEKANTTDFLLHFLFYLSFQKKKEGIYQIKYSKIEIQ